MPEIPEHVARKAVQIQEAFNSAVRVHRDDPDLTPEGRLRRLAVTYLQSKEQMDSLREAWTGTSEAQATAIDKDVFGASAVAGADAISVRDAADRASRLESAEEATRLLEQAERTGDEVLARSVAQYAFDQRGPLAVGWLEVVDAYTARRPEVAVKLQQYLAATRADLSANLGAQFLLSLFKPAELDHLSDHRISLLAETPEPARRKTQAEINREMVIPRADGYDFLNRHVGLS